jgi:hypothetical protein
VNTRTVALTLRWHLMIWSGGSRFAVGPIRTYDTDQQQRRTIGATLSLFRITLGLARFDPIVPGAVGSWYRDFGGRITPRWGIGGWRTGSPVLLSTGWMRSGGRWPCGVSFTLASRTFYVIYLCSAAEYRRPYSEAKRRWARRNRGA